MSDEDEDIRSAAASALGSIGDRAALPLLEAALAKETVESVRDALVDALEDLRKG